MRKYPTGATRDTDDGKLDFDGFLSPYAVRAFAEYMHRHRVTPAGVRDGDNWKKGIPLRDYMKSMWRHFFETWWLHHTSGDRDRLDQKVESLCAQWFNVQGMLHELLKDEPPGAEVVEMKKAVGE